MVTECWQFACRTARDSVRTYFQPLRHEDVGIWVLFVGVVLCWLSALLSLVNSAIGAQ